MSNTNKSLLFIKTIRLPNLIMLALVQAIVSIHFVKEFQVFHYLLITSSTVLIALAAYLLNDIADIEIDTLNNKLKLINPENKNHYFKLVMILNIIGLGLGFGASYMASLSYFAYFVLAVILLSAYAYFFSKYKFFGNLVISFLIALAILLCFYVELSNPFFNRVYYSTSEYSLWIYAAFAFLFNWIREIVKDMEDMEGDKLAGRLSLPISIGVRLSKLLVVAILVYFTIIFTAIAWNFHLDNYYFIFFLVYALFNFLIAIALVFSKTSKAFAKISWQIKLLMLTGLLIPLLVL